MPCWNPPPGHPCSAHSCDGCVICTSGGCCVQTSARLTARTTHPALVAEVLEEIRYDATTHPTPARLIALDSLRGLGQHSEHRLLVEPSASVAAFGERFEPSSRSERESAWPPKALPAPALDVLPFAPDRRESSLRREK